MEGEFAIGVGYRRAGPFSPEGQRYEFFLTLNGRPAPGLGVFREVRFSDDMAELAAGALVELLVVSTGAAGL